MTLPFEFVVEGIPASVNMPGKTYQTWIQTVSRVAQQTWGNQAPLSDVAIRLEIIYFYFKYTQLDIDNIIKPIQDALNQLIYEDDWQVMDVLAQKRDIRGTYALRPTYLPLTAQIEKHQSFVYVKISVISDLEDLTVW